MGKGKKEMAKRVWACAHCCSAYVKYSEAEDCCGPHVEEQYECPICDSTWSDESDAVNCCEGEDDEREEEEVEPPAMTRVMSKVIEI